MLTLTQAATRRRAAEKPEPEWRYPKSASVTRHNSPVLLPLPRSNCPYNSDGGNTLRERILLQPDDYIGSLEKRTQQLWVRESGRFYMKERMVTYVPGLLQIFDEVLIHAADNKQRDPTMDTLRVDVDVLKCRISVFNSGKGIPIELQREGVYLPEVIFGHLSNSDYNVEWNSHGVKLANLFSTEFVVETADGPCQKKYKQVFSDNLGKKGEPEITGYRMGPNWSWTKVTFKPDLAKFNLTCLSEDYLDVMRKRVYDMAAILGNTVQVVFNGEEMILPRGFYDYVYRHVKPLSGPRKQAFPWYCVKVNDQWEVGVTVSNAGHFKQISFVNKVATISGGTHVDYVSNLIVTHAVNFIKNHIPDIEEPDVKRHLVVFVKLCLENPTFSSPTKEALTTPQENFGSELKLSKEFTRRVNMLLLHNYFKSSTFYKPGGGTTVLKGHG